MSEEKPKKLWVRKGKLVLNKAGNLALSDHCCCDDSSASVCCYQKWVTECDEDMSEWLQPVMVDTRCGPPDPDLDEIAGEWMQDESGGVYQWTVDVHAGSGARSYCSQCSAAGEAPEEPYWPCNCERLWGTGYMAEQMVELPYVNVHMVPLLVERWKEATEWDYSESIVQGIGELEGRRYVLDSSCIVPPWSCVDLYDSSVKPPRPVTVKFLDDDPSRTCVAKQYMANYAVGPYSKAIVAGHETAEDRSDYYSAYDSAAQSVKPIRVVDPGGLHAGTGLYAQVANAKNGDNVYGPCTVPKYPIELNDREYFEGFKVPQVIENIGNPQLVMADLDNRALALPFIRRGHLVYTYIYLDRPLLAARDGNGKGMFFNVSSARNQTSFCQISCYTAVAGRWSTGFAYNQWGEVGINKLSPAIPEVQACWVMEARGGIGLTHQVFTSDVGSDMAGGHLDGAPMWHWRSYLHTDVNLGRVNNMQVSAALNGTTPTSSGRWHLMYNGIKCPEYRFMCRIQARYTCENGLKPAPAIPPASLDASVTETVGEVQEEDGQTGREVIVSLPTDSPMPWFEFVDPAYPGQDRTLWLRGDPEYDAKGLDRVVPFDAPGVEGDGRGYAFMMQRLSLFNYPHWYSAQKCSNVVSGLDDCMPRQDCADYLAQSGRCWPSKVNGKYICGGYGTSAASSGTRYVESYTYMDTVGWADLMVEGSSVNSSRITVAGSSMYTSGLYAMILGYGDWHLKWYRVVKSTLSRHINDRTAADGWDYGTSGSCASCSRRYSRIESGLSSKWTASAVYSVFPNETWTQEVRLNKCGRVFSSDGYLNPPDNDIHLYSGALYNGMNSIGWYTESRYVTHVAYLVPDSFCSKQPNWFPSGGGSIGNMHASPYWSFASNKYGGWQCACSSSGGSSGGGGCTYYTFNGRANSVCAAAGKWAVSSANCATDLNGTWSNAYTVAAGEPWEVGPILRYGNYLMTDYGLYRIAGGVASKYNGHHLDVGYAKSLPVGNGNWVEVYTGTNTCSAFVYRKE